MGLTREEIENLGAGPELDAAVAEFVFNSPPGLHCHDRQLCQFDEGMADCEECKSFYANKPAPFSTDIVAATEVADKLIAEGNYVTLASDTIHDTLELVFTFTIAEYYDLPSVSVTAKTRQVAICRAALLRKLEQEETK